MSTSTVTGRAFFRALAYVLKACPSDEKGAKLAHVVFIDRRIVASDGYRWHVGILPEEGERECPLVVTRSSCRELLVMLAAADKVAAMHSGGFFVKLAESRATILYGQDKKIVHDFGIVDVGRVPLKWTEPVAPDAPLLSGDQLELRCGDMRDAMSWYRSWDVDHGGFQLRGEGGDAPVRVDIVSEGERVACAFLLHCKRGAAQLAEDSPLFAGATAEPRGQSILDLSLEPVPLAAPPSCVRFADGRELNTTGIADPSKVYITGPCAHRQDEDPCYSCTEVAIKKELEALAADAGKVVPFDAKPKKKKVAKDAAPEKPKRGRKPKAAEPVHPVDEQADRELADAEEGEQFDGPKDLEDQLDDALDEADGNRPNPTETH